MKSVSRGFALLQGADRAKYICAIFARLALVGLDLIGLIFVGLAATMLLDINSIGNLNTGFLYEFSTALGIQNTYAFVAGLAVLFFILKALLSLLLNSLISRFVARVEAELSSSIFSGYLNSGLESQSRWSNSQIVQGVQDGAFNAFSASLMTFSVITGEAALLASISIFLFITNPALAFIVTIYLGFFALVISRYINRATTKSAENLQETSFGMHSMLGDVMSNYRQIFMTSVVPSYVGRYTKLRRKHSLNQSKIALLQFVPRYVLEAALMLGFAAVMFQRSLDGGVAFPLGTIAIFFAGVFRIVGAILPLQAGLATLKRIEVDSRISYEMVKAFRQTNLQPAVFVQKSPSKFDIELSAVSYKYPKSKKNVIEGFSYQVPYGSSVTVRGKSGVGKSTLADLLLGLIEPTSGFVRVGKYSPRELHEAFPDVIAYVPQKTNLIHGSFLDNLTMQFETPANRQGQVRKLLIELGLSELVANLPNGLMTQMGSGEFNLSGGQLQRVGLARALLKKPKILILDEVTSALDRETEDLIDNVLLRLQGKITIISIAHRQSRVLKHSQLISL
jgi:ABC-type bacteriocin/lantibiotic exporter with double-glycine peptidase domain